MNLGYAYLAYWGTFVVVLWVGPGLLAAVGPEGPVKGIRMVDEDRWQEWQVRAERAEAALAEAEKERDEHEMAAGAEAWLFDEEQAEHRETVARAERAEAELEVIAELVDSGQLGRAKAKARDFLASLSPTGGEDA